jgi:hypothetical protein
MLSWACLATTLSLLLLLPLLNHQHRKNVFATVSESIGGDTIDVIVWIQIYNIRIRLLLFNTWSVVGKKISLSKEFRTNIQCGSIQ